MKEDHGYHLMVIFIGVVVFLIVFSFVWALTVTSKPAMGGWLFWSGDNLLPSIVENEPFWNKTGVVVGAIIASLVAILLVKKVW